MPQIQKTNNMSSRPITSWHFLNIIINYFAIFKLSRYFCLYFTGKDTKIQKTEMMNKK